MQIGFLHHNKYCMDLYGYILAYTADLSPTLTCACFHHQLGLYQVYISYHNNDLTVVHLWHLLYGNFKCSTASECV